MRCDKCNVELENGLKYCPLCGRCLNENITESSSINYPKIVKKINKRKLSLSLVFWTLFLTLILSIASELILYKHWSWNWYVMLSWFLFISLIYLPIKNRWSYSSISAVLAIFLSGFLIFLEYYTNSFGWGLIYAVPGVILAISIFNFISLLARKQNRFELLVPLALLFLVSLGFFIYSFVKGYTIWPILSTLFSNLAFVFIIFVIYFRRAKKEFVKTFYV